MRRLRELLPGRWTTSGWETVPLGLLVLVLLTSGAWGVVAWARPATHPVEIVQTEELPDMASITFPSWGYKDESGLCHIAGPVTVTQQEGESSEDFALRARTTINALYAVFPPDPTCPQAAPQ